MHWYLNFEVQNDVSVWGLSPQTPCLWVCILLNTPTVKSSYASADGIVVFQYQLPPRQVDSSLATYIKHFYISNWRPVTLPTSEDICGSIYFWHSRMHIASTTQLFLKLSGTDTPERKYLRHTCTHFNTHITDTIVHGYLLICSVVICSVLLRLQKWPLRCGCCDLRCTCVALSAKMSRASHRFLIVWAWAADTAKPVRSTSTSASCPALSHPGIPLG